MARHTFLGDLASWVIDTGDSTSATDGLAGLAAIAIPDVVVTFWDALTSGSQYTDLLDASDSPITQVSSDSNGALPSISGPDGVTQMYADAAGDAGPRRLVTATDLGDSLDLFLPLAGGQMTGAAAPSVAGLTAGSSVAVDATAGNDFRLNVTGTCTIATPTGAVDGQRIAIHLIGNGHTVTWDTGYDWGTPGAPTLSTGGKTDVLEGIYDDGVGKWLMWAHLGF